MRLNLNLKGIVPVVTLSLVLLIVILGFFLVEKSLYDTIDKNKELVDSINSDFNDIKILGMDDNFLYVNFRGGFNLTKIEMGSYSCEYSGYFRGVQSLDLDFCFISSGFNSEVVPIKLFTTSGIKSQRVFLDYLENYSDELFVSLWDTRNTIPGGSNSNQISLPLDPAGTYNFNISWGDGTFETITSFSDNNHTYSNPGRYLIKINGTIEGFAFNNNFERDKLLDIRNWGNLTFLNNGAQFRGASNLVISAKDSPNLEGVTNLDSMFEGATSLVGDFSNWNTSLVTSMASMFLDASNFTSDLSSWDVSSVTSMHRMFRDATSFNSNLSNWDTSSVNMFASMFLGATSFNGNLSNWNVSSASDMWNMFDGASSFNGDVSNWIFGDIQNNMAYMFNYASSFNQDLSSWNFTNVTNMGHMFNYATSFNSNLSGWNTSSVINMAYMFSGASNFTSDLSSWDTSSVTSVKGMFRDATSFNSNLSGWNVSLVTDYSSFDTNTPAWILPKPIFS